MSAARVLIANRGVSAVRVVRACRALGLSPVAVYSDADREALHVRQSDEAVRLGPAPAPRSYLDEAAVAQAAVRVGAVAVHPGWGFLAESASFARRLEEMGVTLVGPTADAMRRLGDKQRARELAQALGLPVVPGEPLADGTDALQSARRVGFPLLVKAAAGGGGRGIRVAQREEDLPLVADSARREATRAFGDGTIYLERFLSGVRHVEVQVLGDGRGGLVHVFERDCTVQRRRQKVVEEGPSPAIDAATRAALGEAAVRLTAAAGYRSAGTVEFLVAADGRWYFIEANTRLQVEHGVTELLTGLDLVQAQLRIALGEPLWFRQDDVQTTGHALELRLYAEDPLRDSLPAAGKLLAFDLPDGPRVDAGYAAGDTVTTAYDAHLANIVVHAADRDAALRSAAVALRSLWVAGVPTNQPLLRLVVEHPDFRGCRVTTDWLERQQPEREALPDVVVDALAAHHALRVASDPLTGALAGWRALARVPTRPWSIEGHRIACGARLSEHGALRIRRDDGECETRVARDQDALVFPREGARVRVADDGPRTWLGWEGCAYRAEPAHERRQAAAADVGEASGAVEIVSPLPGVVLQVLVEGGQHVAEREPLVALEAMKMEHFLHAPADGTVVEVRCKTGDQVAAGTLLVVLRTEQGPSVAGLPAEETM